MTFYEASIFFEILLQFGELPPDIQEKQKYASWKAVDISCHTTMTQNIDVSGYDPKGSSKNREALTEQTPHCNCTLIHLSRGSEHTLEQVNFLF